MCKWCALGAREEKCGCCIKHYTLLFHTSLTYSTDLIVLIGASEQSVCLTVWLCQLTVRAGFLDNKRSQILQ